MPHAAAAASAMRSRASSSTRTALALMGHPRPAGAAPPRASVTETQYDLGLPRCQDKAHSGVSLISHGREARPYRFTSGMMKERVGAQWKLRCPLARTDQRFRHRSHALRAHVGPLQRLRDGPSRLARMPVYGPELRKKPRA